jgi:hypothetical protein
VNEISRIINVELMNATFMILNVNIKLIIHKIINI